jgi:hypothetical protein
LKNQTLAISSHQKQLSQQQWAIAYQTLFLKKNSNKINKTKKRKAKQREKERRLPEHSESMCCRYHTSKGE